MSTPAAQAENSRKRTIGTARPSLEETKHKPESTPAKRLRPESELPQRMDSRQEGVWHAFHDGLVRSQYEARGLEEGYEAYPADLNQMPSATQLSICFLAILRGMLGDIPIHGDWEKLIVRERARTDLWAKAEEVITDSGYDLPFLLYSAWKSGKFASIRNAAFLKEAIPKKTTESKVVYAADWRAAEAAWKGEYVSEAHVELFKTIQEMLNDTTTRNVVALVQSSGTGKSRMVDEMAKHVLTISFNLGDPVTKTQAYPPPTSCVRDYLLSPCDTEQALQTRFLHFFEHLFKAVNVRISKEKMNNRSDEERLASRFRTYLAKDWYSDPESQMEEFYSQVVNNAKKGKEIPSKEAFRALNDLFEAIRDHGPESKLPKPHSPNSKALSLVLYFDEAHLLAGNHVRRQSDGSNITYYEVLQDVLGEYHQHPLFVIFLSTVSQIQILAPPSDPNRQVQILSSSTRSVRPTEPGNPITETPFDLINTPIDPEQTTLRMVRGFDFLSMFGRPMHQSLLRNYVDKKSYIDLLRSKIIQQSTGSKECYQPIDAKQGQVNYAYLAVADIRLGLLYEPHARGVTAQADLIASHMRMAYSVPTHRLFFRSGYPSEPLMAEAAAQQLYYWRANRSSNSQKDPLLATLEEHLHSNLLDRGERGEAIARALVTMAYDSAILQEKNKAESLRKIRDENSLFREQLSFSFSDGCSVKSFIESLFQPAEAKKILSSRPHTGRMEDSFESAFGGACIRFTHFVKAVDDHVLDTEALSAAFMRGMAFSCYEGAPAIDFMIPVLLGKEDTTKITPQSMTAIFVQIKRRKKGDYPVIDPPAIGFRFLRSNGEVDGVNGSARRPYVTIVMNLGVQYGKPVSQAGPGRSVKNKPAHITSSRTATASSSTVAPKTPKKKPVVKAVSQTPSRVDTEVKSKKAASTGADVANEHPRYSIYPRGCSNTIYRVISESERPVYKKLLQMSDIIWDHPRQDRLNDVLNLKPFFIGDKAVSYRWYKQLETTSQRAPEEVEEGLDVGMTQEGYEYDSQGEWEKPESDDVEG